MFRIIFYQIIFSFLVASCCFIFWDFAGFNTAILVALAIIFPNFLFAFKLHLISKISIPKSATQSAKNVLTFFFGEFLKIICTGLLLFLIFKFYKNLVPICFAISLIANLQSILIAAFLVKNK